MNYLQQITIYFSEMWKPCLEVILFWYAFYALLKFLRSSGAIQILKGLLVIFLFFVIVEILGLSSISRLMREILPISVIGFLVVFQGELRRGLRRIGQNPIFKVPLKEEKIVDEISKTVSALSGKRIGAIIAFEREVSLKQYAESGVPLDAEISFELISTIFMPNTPLHDGGVIIRGGRIESAGCLFPLTSSQRISKQLGTRHRAAMGLTEETDAAAIVVSEETGHVSFAEKGELARDLSTEEIKKRILNLFQPTKPEAKPWWLAIFVSEKKNEITG